MQCKFSDWEKYSTCVSANEPPSKKSCGRPQEETRTTALRAVVDYIEEHDEEEQITIMDLVSKMDEYLADTGFQAYSAVYMKKTHFFI